MQQPKPADSSQGQSGAPIGSAALPSSRDLLKAVPKLVSGRFVRGLVGESASLVAETARILAGGSAVAPGERDQRFSDPMWSTNPLYRRLMQVYLRSGQFLRRLPDQADLDWQTTERARFAVSLLVDALSPTNTLLGNPAALRRAARTRGRSLVAGARHVADDLANGRRAPLRADPEAFRVGESIAATPGAIIHRTDIYELIQFAPTTETVRERPVLLIPSHVNKHYVLDLTPRRSFAKFSVGRGLSTFCLSWRNVSPSQGHWGLDDYVSACREAVDVVTDVAGTDGVHVVGACSTGVTTAALLGHLAQIGDRRVSTATMLLAIIDGLKKEPVDLFSWEAVLRRARLLRRGGIIEGRDMSVLFRARRSNATIWRFWVNDYLMGEAPPPDDILYWSDDDQNFPGALLDDLVDLYARSALLQPNALTVLGTPIDLSKVDCDAYVLGAAQDHTSPWKGAFRATESFGGSSEFVLAPTGHVQALVMGPRNPMAHFLAGGELGAGPDHWRATATRHRGSWWNHWAQWITDRSGSAVTAPQTLGSRRFPPGDPAPGRYITEVPR